MSRYGSTSMNTRRRRHYGRWHPAVAAPAHTYTAQAVGASLVGGRRELPRMRHTRGHRDAAHRIQLARMVLRPHPFIQFEVRHASYFLRPGKPYVWGKPRTLRLR